MPRDYDNHSKAEQLSFMTCGNFATREILFLVSDVSVVERYLRACSAAEVKQNKKGFYL
jgi:hypothetical protein